MWHSFLIYSNRTDVGRDRAIAIDRKEGAKEQVCKGRDGGTDFPNSRTIATRDIFQTSSRQLDHDTYKKATAGSEERNGEKVHWQSLLTFAECRKSKIHDCSRHVCMQEGFKSSGGTFSKGKSEDVGHTGNYFVKKYICLLRPIFLTYLVTSSAVLDFLNRPQPLQLSPVLQQGINLFWIFQTFFSALQFLPRYEILCMSKVW